MGAKIRIFIGSAKDLNKKSMIIGKNVAFCNVYMLVRGLFDIMDCRYAVISELRYLIMPLFLSFETIGTSIFPASIDAIFIMV